MVKSRRCVSDTDAAGRTAALQQTHFLLVEWCNLRNLVEYTTTRTFQMSATCITNM